MNQRWNCGVLFAVLPYLTGADRRRLRASCRDAETECRLVPFARAVRVTGRRRRGNREGWNFFKWGHFQQLRTKFDFQGIRLLNFDLSTHRVPQLKCPDSFVSSRRTQVKNGAADGSVSLDEVRQLLVGLPGLLLVFDRGGDETEGVKAMSRTATDLDERPEWKWCDRWRVGVRGRAMKHGKSAVHSRVVVCDWNFRWGPLPTSDQWLQEVHVDEIAFLLPPPGHYPLLRKLVTLSRPSPEDLGLWIDSGKLEEWLNQSTTPLLAEVHGVARTPVPRTAYELGPQEDVWLGGGLVVAETGTTNPLLHALIAAGRATAEDFRVVRIHLPWGKNEVDAVAGENGWQGGVESLRSWCELMSPEIGQSFEFVSLHSLTIAIRVKEFGETTQWWGHLVDTLPALRDLRFDFYVHDAPMGPLFMVLTAPNLSRLTALRLFCVGSFEASPLPVVRLPCLATFELKACSSVVPIFKALDSPLRMIHTNLPEAEFNAVRGLIRERFPAADVANKLLHLHVVDDRYVHYNSQQSSMSNEEEESGSSEEEDDDYFTTSEMYYDV